MSQCPVIAFTFQHIPHQLICTARSDILLIHRSSVSYLQILLHTTHTRMDQGRPIFDTDLGLLAVIPHVT